MTKLRLAILWTIMNVGHPNIVCAQNLQSGLVGHYTFSGNAQDSSGNGNNGTVNGATLTTDRCGIPNSAYSFNFTDNSHISLSGIGPSAPTATQYASITFWANYPANPVNGSLGGFALSQYVNGAPQESTFFIGVGPTQVQVAGNGTSSHTSPSTASGWEHWGIILGGTNTLVYKNGLPHSSGPVNYNAQTVSTPVMVGRLATITGGNPTPFYAGDIDDIRIYSRQLTANEVQQIFTMESCGGGGSPNPPNRSTGIVGWKNKRGWGGQTKKTQVPIPLANHRNHLLSQRYSNRNRLSLRVNYRLKR